MIEIEYKDKKCFINGDYIITCDREDFYIYQYGKCPFYIYNLPKAEQVYLYLLKIIKLGNGCINIGDFSAKVYDH